ncbi:MAG TPA: hypothetical protein VN324_01720, partial [Quisquiliibacterium sp.]|nr:hypothetical protein [Quisquiliibacterium sp.]
MSRAERLPACTTIVLAGPPGRAGSGVAAGTLDDAATALAALLDATALDGGALEVFCELPAGHDMAAPARPASDLQAPEAAGRAAATSAAGGGPAAPRIRRHPPSADLIEALRVLRARGELDPDRDIAWVCAGTRVPAMWNARLQASLRRDPSIGCVSPLCAEDPLYTPLETDDEARPAPAPPAGPSPAFRAAGGLDAWLRANGRAEPAQMPSPLPWCGVLRADVAAELLALRDESQRGAA